MRLTSLLPLLLFACSSESTPTFTDAASAMDQGEQALVANDYDLAADAFRFAASDEGFAAEALQGLFRAQVGEAFGDEKASATLAALKASHSDELSTPTLKSLADSCINAGALALAEEVVAMNLSMHPDEMEAFRAVIDGIEAKRSGDIEALAELGYVGD